VLDKFIRQVQNSDHLTREQVRACVDHLVEENLSAESKADFLCNLALKGETVEEIGWFAEAMREKALSVPIAASWRRNNEILDVCGTGGDRLNTFNISTTVALVCAAAGVPVAKHGNRAATSQAGSADVLEALGIGIDLPPAEGARSLQERNFTFCFAPNYHPAFKHIAAARKLCAARGQRTIFNFLGPLLNPALPTVQLVGVPDPALCKPLAHVLATLGVHHAMVVSGAVDRTDDPAAQNPTRHLDELSIFGQNTVAEFSRGAGSSLSFTLKLDEFPLQPARLSDLAGGDPTANAEIVVKLLRGEERGPKRDAVLLNSAAALLVADRVSSITDGWQLAAEVIDSGQAEEKLAELKTGM
jgi:anthranilate phosphoribosyltransferase